MRIFTRLRVVLLLFALLLPLLAACGGTPEVAPPTTAPAAPAATPEPEAPTEVPTEAPVVTTDGFQPRDLSVTLTGSGASFPDPVYQAWIERYRELAPNVTINYQAVGSGQGRRDFYADITDMGGTDRYASDEELEAYGAPFFHIPTVLGAVVATYNLPGVDELQFSGETLVEIFFGRVTNWSDPLIAEDNPGVDLPDLPITVVHRSDGSGTTSIFTEFLSAISDEWATEIGASDSVEWPTGIGGQQNAGVAAAVAQTEGAIGYVELIYALSNNLPAPAVRNAVGNFVKPTLESTSQAAAGFLAAMPADMRVNIVNPPDGENAYPIAGFTWLLVREEMSDLTTAQALADFLFWAITEGDEEALALRYAPLPEEVKLRTLAMIARINVNGTPAIELPEEYAEALASMPEPEPEPVAAAAFEPRDLSVTLTGSGASFPDPVYQAWIEQYRELAPNVTINYQAVGSGQGRRDFYADITDMGGTDRYASDEEIEAYGAPFFHIPTVLGAVVATYNLPGVDELQFSGETLVEIFFGRVTNWNDPLIAEDNPGVDLPDLAITVVHRSDGSGTTSIFTEFLSAISDEWATEIGASDSVEWPTGIGGQQNAGVAAAVAQTEGAIGYVELIYALSNNLPAPAVRNAVGNFVKPTLESTSQAAAGFLAAMPADMRVNIVNPPDGENAYPIAGFTWLLVREEMSDLTTAQALVDFLYWAINEGDEAALALRYAPLPDEVKELANEMIMSVNVDGVSAFER
ncbi:phosphate ABC transporter substrate-binding protein PstS [Candidatus Viridilinea mediisalina]|uniref:PBP domain-containing protein n=1 Tax=Candidatus Viridilinea mediisalina TaxID=2024553 RepID=A0A2A6RFF6_9CHLR|nr:phosphate ABC transporter substrate-binding protein PstS [Candidatus Viridilinea mediisalina]PDW01605.1 hypothetical protein CJ255_18280 [Candidatus Viridilinea mediisalina]